MTLSDFSALDYKGMLYAAKEAVYLAGRSDEDHTIMLYQLNGFYIEVYFHKQNNFISSLHPFADTELLEPYLESIEIDLTY